jgi:hypothetical protein
MSLQPGSIGRVRSTQARFPFEFFLAVDKIKQLPTDNERKQAGIAWGSSRYFR